MNEYYRELLYPLTTKWIEQYHLIYDDQENTYTIQTNDKAGTIKFYGESLMELKITKINSEDILFYLHFELTDLKSTFDQLHLFFECLECSESEYEHAIEVNGISNVLICCSGGFTSAYFAYYMQDILENEGINIQIDALSYPEVDEVQENYDLILLAPQIAYIYPEFRAKYGTKVKMINTKLFATQKFHRILEETLH